MVFFILLIFYTLKIFNLCCSIYVLPWGVSWGLFNAIVFGYLYPASLYLSQHVTASVQPKYSRYPNPVYEENPFNLPRTHNVIPLPPPPPPPTPQINSILNGG